MVSLNILVIGNGFDLSLDMKTGYTDFIEWYGQQDIYDIKKEYLVFVKEGLSDPMRWHTWSGFETDLAAFASRTSLEKRKELKDLYIDILNKIAEYIRFN